MLRSVVCVPYFAPRVYSREASGIALVSVEKRCNVSAVIEPHSSSSPVENLIMLTKCSLRLRITNEGVSATLLEALFLSKQLEDFPVI
ncbi:hypothetical protein SCP_0209880 [Sparassis crispa]|uniref:Uncharacterized protein n=1 Tax=Sparassis crispa TaxID=139825 RepID=A0A401GCA5_9APHY|nr:hypothetical protein SCP_0209880 [Sparassis crispa]GBE79787.1 hypothetical protein SCP_0209880 [Sparassis crispa]